MNSRRSLYELPGEEVFVRAAPEICFQVVWSAGRVIERYPTGERLVEFSTSVGRRRVLTKEIVSSSELGRIDYRWIEGPLPAVEETITVVPADGGASLRYEGRFGVDAPWPVRSFLRRSVARQFSRAVHGHLIEAKEISERRAQRSHRHPRS